jgi:Lrp/AsnC family transcriptional regulator, leucine-responsive regulatory protein
MEDSAAIFRYWQSNLLDEPMPRTLDRIDRKILATLLSEGRLGNVQLAERVGLSATPCWQRVRRLESEGIIRGYSAVLDQDLLGAPDIVIVEVTLDVHDDAALEVFGSQMANIPEILEAYLTTGEYDYMLKVAVNGTKGYEEFLRTKLYKVPGIRHSRSSFALRCLKHVQAHIPA